jgi:hypothetical protein
VEGLKSFNLVFASHECACVDVLPELAVAAGLVRREPLGRGLGRRCEVDCLLHVNIEAPKTRPMSTDRLVSHE